MAQFSIREALRFSFYSYVHNIGLVFFAGFLLSGSALVLQQGSQYLASKYGVDISIHIDLNDSKKDTSSLSGSFEQKGALTKAHDTFKKVVTHLQNKKKSDMAFAGLIFLVTWLVQLLLSIGLAKVSLTLKDEKRASRMQLFEGYPVMARWIGASLLMLSYAVGLALLVIACAVPFAFIVHAVTKSDDVTAIVTIAACLCCLLAVVYRFLGYSFFGFSLLDVPGQTVRGCLRASQSLVQHSRLKFVGAVLVLTLVCGVIGILVTAVVNGIASLTSTQLYCTKDTIKLVATLFSAPFGTLYLASLYRDLTQPRPIVSK